MNWILCHLAFYFLFFEEPSCSVPSLERGKSCGKLEMSCLQEDLLVGRVSCRNALRVVWRHGRHTADIIT